MKGFDNSTYLTLYIISNVVALILLFVAWKAPKIARLIFFLLFAWASCTNWTYALKSPQSYLEYADLAFLNFYRHFIQGWFSRHITIIIGFIATCQAAIAVSMLLRHIIFKAGAIGGIIFFIAIAPFGVGSAFPCTVLMAIGMYGLLKKDKAGGLFFKRKAPAHQLT